MSIEGCFDAYLARLHHNQQHLGVAVDIGLTASSVSGLLAHKHLQSAEYAPSL